MSLSNTVYMTKILENDMAPTPKTMFAFSMEVSVSLNLIRPQKLFHLLRNNYGLFSYCNCYVKILIKLFALFLINLYLRL